MTRRFPARATPTGPALLLLLATGHASVSGATPQGTDASQPPIAGARVIATLEERDLIPEGTAWDPESSHLLIGSLHKYTIVAVAPDGSVRDLVPRGAHGLRSVVGIHVDASRRTLWATSNARYETPSDSTPAALYAFDVRTGALRTRVALPGPGTQWFLNDLVTTPDGTVYATDSRAGCVWRLRPGARALERFEAAGTFSSPNGITATDDGTLLFVAGSGGITAVPLGGGERWRLAAPDSVDVSGIDGLAWTEGALVAHHPLRRGRVAWYALDAGRRRVTAHRLLEAGTPDVRTSTTGEVVGRDYVFIGNSQIDRMNARTIDAATMDPVRLYRVSLQPRPAAHVVVSLAARDSIAVLDAHTLVRVATLAAGRTPHEIAVSPDGTRAYVADAGDTTITVVAHGEVPSVVATWSLPDSLSVHDVAVSSDGRTVWGASGTRQAAVQLDASTGGVMRRWPLARAGGWNLAMTRAALPVVVAHLEGGAVTSLDPATGRSREIALAVGEIDAVPTMDGSAIWSVNARTGTLSVIDTRAWRVVHTERASAALSRVVMTPDGRTALVVSAADSSVVAYDVRTRERRGTVTIAGDPKVIALGPDGRRAYVTHPARGRLTLIDVASLTVLRTAEVAGTPDGVAVLEPRR